MIEILAIILGVVVLLVVGLLALAASRPDSFYDGCVGARAGLRPAPTRAGAQRMGAGAVDSALPRSSLW